jgi:hypothetical protein
LLPFTFLLKLSQLCRFNLFQDCLFLGLLYCFYHVFLVVINYLILVSIFWLYSFLNCYLKWNAIGKFISISDPLLTVFLTFISSQEQFFKLTKVLSNKSFIKMVLRFYWAVMAWSNIRYFQWFYIILIVFMKCSYWPTSHSIDLNRSRINFWYGLDFQIVTPLPVLTLSINILFNILYNVILKESFLMENVFHAELTYLHMISLHSIKLVRDRSK